jgi:hypothetical protein
MLQRRLRLLGTADRPNTAPERLIAEEERLRERIGFWLKESQDLQGWCPASAVEVHLCAVRLQFAIDLLWLLASPHSPCRVRSWDNKLHWLLSLSWTFFGADRWAETERARAPGDFFAA